MTEQEKTRFFAFLENWLDGIDDEAGFWDGFIRTRAGDYPHLYKRMFEPNPEFLHPDLARDGLKVLDVGSGPVSLVGRAGPHAMELRACDALAPIYNLLLKRYGVTPYVGTEFALVERLTDTFGEEAFDLVCMSNALDHSFDPLAGVFEMLRVVRTGGLVRLTHYANEAETEDYDGLHQWNIDLREGRLTFWNRRDSIDVSELLSGLCEIKVRESEKDIVGLTKRVIHADLVKLAHPPRDHGPMQSAFTEFLLRTLFTQVSPRALALDEGIRSGYFVDTLCGMAAEGDSLRKALFKKWLCLRVFTVSRVFLAGVKRVCGLFGKRP